MKAFLFVCLFLFVRYYNGNAAKATSGPFKATVIRAANCNQTTYPVNTNPPLTLTLQVYNSSKGHSLLRGNFTVFRENKQIKLKIKKYVWQNEKWKLLSMMNNIGCHGVLFHTMMIALGLKYDRENCGYIKGQYYFQDLYIDALQHIWTSEMEYGRILWVTETTRGYATYTCYEFESLIEPL